MSVYPMISMEAAEKLIEENAVASDVEVVNVKNAFHRILREDVYSFCHLPPFRASVKDGYAILASDGKGRRKVLGKLEAGFAVSILEIIAHLIIFLKFRFKIRVVKIILIFFYQLYLECQ